MNTKYFIGIDPGLSGALTCLDLTGNVRSILVMPVIKVGKRRQLDVKAIIAWFKKCYSEEVIRIVALEEQRPMHKQGVTSTFTTGRGYGILEGIVSALDMPYEVIRAVDWQREMFRGLPKDGTKALSGRKAQQLYPSETFLKTPKCTKIHDGMTDSVLIAEYIRRKLK